eukprot:scaffold33277_cov139-Skeletonema_dohrnii-CCMP3373.AAC.1
MGYCNNFERHLGQVIVHVMDCVGASCLQSSAKYEAAADNTYTSIVIARVDVVYEARGIRSGG